MLYSTCFRVLLLIGVAFAEIYVDEDFEDDSWQQRWITTTINGTKLGKFERSTVEFYGGASSKGLRHVGVGGSKNFILSTRFNAINIENQSLVVQFSVKYGQNAICDMRYMQLYSCSLPPSEMHGNTPHILQFGSEICGDKKFGLEAENLWGQRFESFIELPIDKYTHVYMLILRPNQSYEIIFDDGKVFRKIGNLVKNQMRVHEQNGSRNLDTMYPNICGIGFEFSHQYGDHLIFGNILLTDDVSIAKRRRDNIFAEMSQWKLGGSDVLVDVGATNFEKILDCKIDNQSRGDNHTHSIFGNFDKFLVPFNWSDNNTFLVATAEYNMRHRAPNESINLWVSFVPQSENISYDIEAVLKVVVEANNVAPKTVTTVVISYGFLQLDKQTLSFVNHEIGKVSKRLKSLTVQAPDLALQLSDINCRSSWESLYNLDANLLDFFLLMPMPQTKQFHSRDNNDKKVISCGESADLINVTVPTLIHSYESVEMDFDKGVYNCSTLTHKHASLYLNAITMIRAVDKIHGKDLVDTEQVTKFKNLANWLYQPTDFNKSHFGAVIGWKDVKLMGIENFASTILGSFRHIMIGISTHDNFETEDHLEAIVLEIARYSLLIKKRNSIENHIQKGNTQQLRISILVTVESNDFEVNQRQARRVISAARKGNAVAPNIVHSVFFDFLACTRSEICSESNQYNFEMVCLHAAGVGNLSNIYDYADAAIYKDREDWESVVWLGRVEDKLFDELLSAYKKNECVGESGFDKFNRAFYLLCKTVLDHQDIVNYGGLKAFKIATDSFSFCPYSSKTNQYSLVYFYVNIFGCAGGHSNMTLLVEYALLMEKLSKWAASDNILLFVTAGVEPSQCNASDERLAEEQDCGCGWWIKQESSGSYQDKKSVARQLYEIAQGIAITDDIKKWTVVPPKSLLWLWILIPVATFGALITIPAVFLIFYYRSKYILTKREVEEFIKGRQATRAEPVGEGDEAAEAQVYNTEKYEMSPSTFTIDKTSNCLGSGEYGRVYRASIRRDGAVIETAAKVTNSNLIGKSHGYYLALKGLLSEIKILAYVGEHNHIVGLLGAYTKKVRKGEIAVFLELCQLGSLDKYLRTIKPQIIDVHVASNNETLDPDAIYVDEEENERGKIQVLDQESSKDLFRWAGEIASGMEFLASKKLVHADLASRNVLLTSERIAKISDFGLSRRLYDYTEYVKQSQAPLPWRWMAPESLSRMFFNEKTDIWAFGVTLWEMFTLGDEPYPGLSWTSNFSALLERGLRLPEPRFNSEKIYSVMMRCWNINPSQRPSFAQVKSELNPV